jgi:hypothetical protein
MVTALLLARYAGYISGITLIRKRSKTMNMLLFCEVPSLQERDVEKEVGLRQTAHQDKTAKNTKPGTIKRFIMVSFSSTQDDPTAKPRKTYPR